MPVYLFIRREQPLVITNQKSNCFVFAEGNPAGHLLAKNLLAGLNPLLCVGTSEGKIEGTGFGVPNLSSALALDAPRKRLSIPD